MKAASPQPPSRLSLLVLALVLAGLLGPRPAAAQDDPTTWPLLGIADLVFEGAFRLPADTYGASSLNYAEGPFAYDPDQQAIYIVGHNHQQAIAAFGMPALVNSTVLDDLNMAGAPLQDFTTVLGRASGGNAQSLNRIGGLAYLDGPDGPELLVNAYEYYDAPGDNTQTTLAVRGADALATAPVDGFFQYDGGAGHTSGWISPIPAAWQALLGGTHLTGQSSGIPIISRTSVGPSAFAFDPYDVVGSATVPTPIPTTKLLDFSLQDPLHADLSNSGGDNTLWTHLSRVVYGVVVPGTRTYATFGYSGGHASGVCYKCTQSNGNLCGGYCAPDADDYDQYYWLWDVNDLLAVKAGTLNAYDVRPYAHGAFPTPFQVSEKQLGGGAYDPASGLLYLSVLKADRDQGTYANPPVMIAYRFDTAALPVELAAFEAAVDADAVVLRWTTLRERNNAGFSVEMAPGDCPAAPCTAWAAIAFMKGEGTTEAERAYQHRTAPLKPGTYRFRLKQIDFDGAFRYSREVAVAVTLPGATRLEAPFPNPFQRRTHLRLTVPAAQTMQVDVYDLQGRRVERLFDGRLAAGTTTFDFLAGDRPNGIYLIQCTGERFTAIRKAVLIR